MDMISNLPDSILSNILSLLPTNLAATTSVLSKRWQFLWTMVHNLDLELDTYQLLQGHEGGTAKCFVDFVNRFFSQRDKHLSMKSFRLKIVTRFKSIHVDSWVLAAMSCNVQEFGLSLNINHQFLYRCSVLNSTTLVVLKLSGCCIVIDGPPSIHFPRLKVLHLLSVKYKDHHSLSNLISGCPVLEDLVFYQYCTCEELWEWDNVIFLLTVRELVLHLDYSLISIRLWVEAPSLEHLELRAAETTTIYFKNLDNLVNAVVNLSIPEDDSYTVEEALAPLYNVQVLELEESTLKAIDEDTLVGIPMFQNLVKLKLDGYWCFWRKLLSLLHKVPYLQHLSITMDEEYYLDCVFLGSEEWAKVDTPKCLSRLKTLCFYNAFGWHDEYGICYDDMKLWNDIPCDDMQFLKYMLKNSTVLENVKVTCWSKLNKEIKDAFRKEIASLERGSKQYQIMSEGEVMIGSKQCQIMFEGEVMI